MGPLAALAKIAPLWVTMARHAMALRNRPPGVIVLVDFGVVQPAPGENAAHDRPSRDRSSTTSRLAHGSTATRRPTRWRAIPRRCRRSPGSATTIAGSVFRARTSAIRSCRSSRRASRLPPRPRTGAPSRCCPAVASARSSATSRGYSARSPRCRAGAPRCVASCLLRMRTRIPRICAAAVALAASRWRAGSRCRSRVRTRAPRSTPRTPRGSRRERRCSRASCAKCRRLRCTSSRRARWRSGGACGVARTSRCRTSCSSVNSFPSCCRMRRRPRATGGRDRAAARRSRSAATAPRVREMRALLGPADALDRCAGFVVARAASAEAP